MSGDSPHAVRFFDEQFRRQVRDGEFTLNPFETAALAYVRGDVLDLGCGLGNLSLEAARRGSRVVAVDASPTAIERLRTAATAERLPVRAIHADVESYAIEGTYDTVLAIGLLMFFERATALRLLASVQEAVRRGGVAFVTVLIEGTTFRALLDPERHHLFGATELRDAFEGWEILEVAGGTFDAPGGTKKVFSTVAARKPS